ncbi:uracil-DNA glycosylase [Curvibacter sp. CHRR-16]|uniref:uracil-DNA glycosylase n=1 Tax=Curvibacter sp. CHRR-16 TaxID=2835872 RepID=UPI001BDAEDAD|nr:uracil-DNA glycosylase [Curvibacter sp. CHRR-16]MBT0570030.1 uracil-DNA glycosylase [Curvibacter sp. CHRR-16]
MWPWDERQQAMLEEMGIRLWHPSDADANLPAPTENPAPPAPPAPRPVAQTPAPSPVVSAPVPAPAAGVADALVQSAAQCTACTLCKGRRNSTLQALPVQPQHWLVVGDPPDEAEDAAGSPFVGDAGLLLDNMLKAVGASRSGAGAAGARVVNVVRCRPPVGQLPSPADMAQCRLHLDAEIAHVQPRVIVALGRFAAQSLLATETPHLVHAPPGKLRGQVFRYGGIPLVVSYHPKMLLRNSADKAQAWADWCLAWDALENS